MKCFTIVNCPLVYLDSSSKPYHNACLQQKISNEKTSDLRILALILSVISCLDPTQMLPFSYPFLSPPAVVAVFPSVIHFTSMASSLRSIFCIANGLTYHFINLVLSRFTCTVLPLITSGPSPAPSLGR